MLLSARRHVALKARRGVFPSRNVQTPQALPATGVWFGHFEDGEGGRHGSQPQSTQVKGGRPGRQARSRAQGRIGVPPVFPIRVQDDDQKLAGRTSPRSHSPIGSRHSATQARRLCYHRLGVMPLLRPVGASSLLEMSKLQRHFLPGYDRCCPYGTRSQTFRNSI